MKDAWKFGYFSFAVKSLHLRRYLIASDYICFQLAEEITSKSPVFPSTAVFWGSFP